VVQLPATAEVATGRVEFHHDRRVGVRPPGRQRHHQCGDARRPFQTGRGDEHGTHRPCTTMVTSPVADAIRRASAEGICTVSTVRPVRSGSCTSRTTPLAWTGPAVSAPILPDTTSTTTHEPGDRPLGAWPGLTGTGRI